LTQDHLLVCRLNKPAPPAPIAADEVREAGKEPDTDPWAEISAICLAHDLLGCIVDELEAENATILAALTQAQGEVEKERLRLAMCGVVARGASAECKPEYESDSLRAVVALRAELAAKDAENAKMREARKALAELVEDLELRSNLKRGDDKGLVDCGDGVYQRAKAALKATGGE